MGFLSHRIGEKIVLVGTSESLYPQDHSANNFIKYTSLKRTCEYNLEQEQMLKPK